MRFLSVAMMVTVFVPSVWASDWSYDSKSDPFMSANISLSAAQAVTPQGSQAVLAQQVAALGQAQVDAWNKHDLQAYLKWYWNSPELISLSNGDEIVGFAALANDLRTGFGSEPNSMGHVQMGTVASKDDRE